MCAHVELVLLFKSGIIQLSGIVALNKKQCLSVWLFLCAFPITSGCSVSLRLVEAHRCSTPGYSVCVFKISHCI